MPKFDTASVRDSASSLVAAMSYPCWLTGIEVNAAMWTVFSKNDLKAAKSLVLLASSPRRIHALYSLAKRPVRLSTRMPMSKVSLLVIGCPESLANVTPWNRCEVSTSIPLRGANRRPLLYDWFCDLQPMCARIL